MSREATPKGITPGVDAEFELRDAEGAALCRYLTMETAVERAKAIGGSVYLVTTSEKEPRRVYP